MRRFTILCLALAFVGISMPTEALSRSKEKNRAEVVARSQGYYKDVFMDSGIALSSRRDLPSAPFLGLTMESFISSVNRHKPATKLDTLLQAKVMCGCEEDTNGRLLYPDGAPRYRMIYMNGGSASKHARSLFKDGREHICQFVAGGGSYLGTCAGAYLASSGAYSPKRGVRHTKLYLSLWPAYAHSTRLSKSKTAMTIAKKSPLLRYFDFGGDKRVDDVFHNGGCYAYWNEKKPFPKGGEILSYYIYNDTEKVKIDGQPSAWSYKANKQSGRVVSCGSHPEGVKKGDRLEYMAAMVLHAIEGNGTPTPKGVLKAGDVREMNKRSEDNNPAYTRIGDKQYHHFELQVPKKCQRAVVTLEGYEGENNFDLVLCANRKELAYCNNATQKSDNKGTNKQLTIEKPKSGKWYVSVLCETTVEATLGQYGTEYSGRTDVLNGVPYKISVKYE
uniref:BPL-N domain-containing protein n=1 Tax=Alistipes sp. TaxID=1872444 RepID=UPI0040579676